LPHDELPGADGSVVEQRPHQAIDWITAEIPATEKTLPLRWLASITMLQPRMIRPVAFHTWCKTEIEQSRADPVVSRRISRAVG